MDWIDGLRVRRDLRRSRNRQPLEQIAPALYACWQRSAPQEFPGMPAQRASFYRAASGLFDFFQVASLRGQPCALPSLAADSVWHAWLQWDADDLARFCRRHFTKAIAHLPQSELGPAALVQTLVGCRYLEGARAHGPGLPQLFGLDAGLRVPNGHGYWIDKGEIVYRRLDAAGRRSGQASVHSDLTLQALFAASLISEATYLTMLKKYGAAAPTSAQLGDSGIVLADPSDDGGCAADGGGGGGGCGGGGD